MVSSSKHIKIWPSEMDNHFNIFHTNWTCVRKSGVCQHQVKHCISLPQKWSLPTNRGTCFSVIKEWFTYTLQNVCSNHNWFLLLQIDDLFPAHTKNIRIRPSLTRTYSRSRCKIRRIRHPQSFMGVSMCFTGHLGVCFIHQKGECGDRLEATSIPNEH